MCLSNWGGISHQMLHFHEHINLFSGKSGSGKSTVMDALQVVLYGSLHQSFLNKAADDSKNRRSVLSYLRGAQKDGTSNRGEQDFCALLSIEIEDVWRQTFACIGVLFEVRKGDTDLKRYHFFSHDGKIPEDEYLVDGQFPYSISQIKKLLTERKKQGIRFGRGDINRLYHSHEAYQRTVFDTIFGYVDGNRFTTMEKSAIALQMSNGTGQFIKDYMFPKSESQAIEELSQQLGIFRDIKERIEDMHNRIDLLQKVQDAWQEKLSLDTDILQKEQFVTALEIRDTKDRLEAANAMRADNEAERTKLTNRKQELEEEKSGLEQEVIQCKADLKASDLGSKEEKLSQTEQLAETLAFESGLWRTMCEDLTQWLTNEVIMDYVSSEVEQQIEDIRSHAVTLEKIECLRTLLEEEKANLEEIIEDNAQQLRKLQKEQEEKRIRIEDIKNNRKSYPEELRKAKSLLASRLNDRFTQSGTVKVYVFADLFDVKDREWKNAIEGRLGRLKYALITKPEFASEAAAVFRSMKNFENVDLINSQAIARSVHEPKEGSLYEAVETKYEFVDACLKRYLGHIIKCDDLSELEQVKDGVTRDCYSYSNFMFRHLHKRDYTARACIGSVVSREKLADYQQELAALQEQADQLTRDNSALKQARTYECFHRDTEEILRLYRAGAELTKVNAMRQKLATEVEQLRSGDFAQMQKRLEEKQAQLDTCRSRLAEVDRQLTQILLQEGSIGADIRTLQETLEDREQGFALSDDMKEKLQELLEHAPGITVKNRLLGQLSSARNRVEDVAQQVQEARNAFNLAYPACGLHGAERDNTAYDKLLSEYRDNYEPKYQVEFESQCDVVYKGLRDNVIAAIHGDIKAAKRHQQEINRLLGQTHFSDSTYQIEIQPADNENGQFYEMLMAEELDTKNIEDSMAGQISFGEDDFYRKYAAQIDLLTEKFMPIRDDEEELVALKRQREMEQYADYRNYLSFRMYERVEEADGTVRRNYVDDMAGRDSGGEGQNPKYVALLAGFAMLYMPRSTRDSKFRLVLLDEAFSKMDQERSAVCLHYARMMELQLIVCVPDERLQSLIRNVDSVYGFRRYRNQISMMHIDKGDYLSLMDGDTIFAGLEEESAEDIDTAEEQDTVKEEPETYAVQGTLDLVLGEGK